jgi:hypothetical protein
VGGGGGGGGWDVRVGMEVGEGWGFIQRVINN